MPDETENGVPVIQSAMSPPTGAESTTPSTVMNGNFKLLYNANSRRNIRHRVSGRMTFSCRREAVYSVYSPPQSKW